MRSLSAAAAVLATAVSPMLLATPARAAVAVPGTISSVKATPGPLAGQVTFTWSATGANTTSFQIETGLTTFKVGDPVLPDHGRGVKYFTVSPTRRSVTLTAAQVASAGARAPSANHLYYRFKAVNRTSSGTSVRNWPYLQNVAVRPGTPSSAGTPLRVASYNVRTATNATGVRPWLQRVPGIARTILSRDPGVVALQELGVNRADGTSASVTGAVTQVESLLDTLRANGGERYQLVRRTRFVAPGTPEATQGARILYDSTRYRVVSSCPDSGDGTPLDNDSWSSSCTVALPSLSTDGSWTRRRASYALLADRATGKQFWVASAHLDQRHSEDCRKRQRRSNGVG